MVELLKGSPPLRRFFAAFFQSQVGSGAAYVALLVVAYHRLHSGWAISLVLLGEFLPGIVLTPICGSLADRCSRRRLAVCADLLRAGCFMALALVPSFLATVGFALLAGVGSALFRPAVNAALPGMVEPERRSELTAIFYACVNSGQMLGPALTGTLLLITGAPVVLLVNAGTFVVSALLLATLDLGPPADERAAGAEEPQTASLLTETRDGARVIAELPGVPVVMVVAALVVLTGAVFNVAAPLLSSGALHLSGAGYGLLMTLYGAGMVAGSWATARAGSEIARLRRRWRFGIALSGLAIAAAALAPNLGFALIAFAMIGVGENLLVGPEMRLVQEMIPASLHGRAFGLKDVLENVAFVVAFIGAGALLSLFGPRIVLLGAGLLTVGLSAVGGLAARGRAEVGPALVLAD